MSKRTSQSIAFLEQNLRAKAWHDFLKHIGWYTNCLLVPLANNIWDTIPPTYIRTSDDHWEHLRQIAAGHVNIPGCGLVCRGKLTQFLRENDPEGD